MNHTLGLNVAQWVKHFQEAFQEEATQDDLFKAGALHLVSEISRVFRDINNDPTLSQKEIAAVRKFYFQIRAIVGDVEES